MVWIDEEVALYTVIQLETPRAVTKQMSEINYRSSAKQGDIIEIGIDVVSFGTTSLTVMFEVRNRMARETIIMVGVDEYGKPKAHGKTKVECIRNRLNIKR